MGRKDTEAAASAVRGLTDALEGSDCQILWHYYQEKRPGCLRESERTAKSRYAGSVRSRCIRSTGETSLKKRRKKRRRKHRKKHKNRERERRFMGSEAV